MRGIGLSAFRTYSIVTIIMLAHYRLKGKTHRSTAQNRELRNRPTQIPKCKSHPVEENKPFQQMVLK